MAVAKVLLDFTEYQRLKLIETKYHHIKQLHSNSAIQDGKGSTNFNSSLEKTVMENENDISIDPPSPEIVDPISVPAMREDIDKLPGSSDVLSTESTQTKKGKKNKNPSPLRKDWWFLGIPKHS